MSCSDKGAYFPDQPVDESPHGLYWGNDEAIWESQYLRKMQEPSLYNCAGRNLPPTYRFLWDRSLSEPIAVRFVVNQDGSGTLFAKSLAHGGLLPPQQPGHKPISEKVWFQIATDRQVHLAPDKVRHALELFSKIRFVDDTPEPKETTDGSDWIFESKVNGRYRYVDFRNKPSPDARDLGLYLVLDLANIPIPKGAIY